MAMLPSRPADERVTPGPLYELLKRSVIGQIESGTWTPGMRIPSENEIAAQWAVSRQTANRALRELSDEGYITRVQGVGSFVADRKYQSGLELHSLADEIAARGHVHRAEVLVHEREIADDFVAWSLDLSSGAVVFHSKILHHESGLPIQLEDRFVNPAADPDYLAEDYSTITPAQRLLRVLPIVEMVEEAIEATVPTDEIMEHLQMDAKQPCLVVRRRTWANGAPVTLVTLTHPGHRYRIVVKFRPGESGFGGISRN